MKYRKLNSVSLEAIQWKGNNLEEVLKLSPTNLFVFDDYSHDKNKILIESSMGKMYAEAGDWIILEKDGKIYPCKNELFKSQYVEEIPEDINQDKFQHLYRDERHLKIKVQAYPFNIRINMQIETNFGEIRWIFDHPPLCEERIGEIIQSVYSNLINELYETHEKKGGKFIGKGNGECNIKEWFEKNGKTLIVKESMLIKR